MTPAPSQPDRDLAVGLASGLAAGLFGAFVMTGFQALLSRAGVTSGVAGRPSTDKAAQLVARATTGHALDADREAGAGEALHYAVGSLVGGAYGIAAEVDPRATAGEGAAFGVVAASVVDETLVPAFGLGDPIWNAPLFSHPYSYASHLVFGTATEAGRKLFRRFFKDVKAGAAVIAQREESPTPMPPRAPLSTEGASARRSLGLAFLIGATAGPRASAPLTAVTWAARLGLIDLAGSPLAALATTHAVSVTTPMALGELVADKLPSTPSRTQPVGVGARVVNGAVSGAALVGGRSWTAALAGAAGALAATYLGHAARVSASKTLGRDWPVALTEDVIAFGGAALVCLAAVAPADDATPEATRA